MKIWAHTLFKNEEKWLWYSVTSVIDYVDKILLWDTGSEDDSAKIAKELKRIYPEKIDLKWYGEVDVKKFTQVRQEMLDKTNSDWFMVVDGDEIWWEESVRNLCSEIELNGNGYESIVVPTVNMVGDIFHYQDKKAGKYKFGNLEGHYNLRAIKRNISGLHSQGDHGVWGWADENNRQVQERKSYKFVDAPYIHATFLRRGGSGTSDEKVPKRSKKYKHEIGIEVPLDYYYPETFFREKPQFVKSPWEVMEKAFKVRAYIETPFRKLKRRAISGRVGY